MRREVDREEGKKKVVKMRQDRMVHFRQKDRQRPIEVIAVTIDSGTPMGVEWDQMFKQSNTVYWLGLKKLPQ